MAFFEKLGKSASDAGRDSSQSARNRAEISRLDAEINDAKKRASTCFAALGEAYYKRHRDDPEAEELVLVREITRLLGEISGYEEEIRRLRELGKCQVCGADTPEGAAFCSACGAKLPARERVVCQSCGRPLKEGNRFCTFCGSPAPETERIPETKREDGPAADAKREKDDGGNAAE